MNHVLCWQECGFAIVGVCRVEIFRLRGIFTAKVYLVFHCGQVSRITIPRKGANYYVALTTNISPSLLHDLFRILIVCTENQKAEWWWTHLQWLCHNNQSKFGLWQLRILLNMMCRSCRESVRYWHTIIV